jgi:hypothetical protein
MLEIYNPTDEDADFFAELYPDYERSGTGIYDAFI